MNKGGQITNTSQNKREQREHHKILHLYVYGTLARIVNNQQHDKKIRSRCNLDVEDELTARNSHRKAT